MAKQKKFKLGQRVTWRSQANGSWVRKTGEVVDVVLPHSAPGYVGFGRTRRDHESYVVRVPGRTAKAKPSVYWPVAAQLAPGGRHKLGREAG